MWPVIPILNSILKLPSKSFFNLRLTAVALFSFFCFGMAHAQNNQNSVFDLVQKVVDNQDKITLEGVKVSVYWIGADVILQSVHVLREPNRWRFDYFPVKNHSYQVAILDQGAIYHMKPSRRLIFRQPYDPKDYENEHILNLAADNYDWIDEGTVLLSGVKCHQVAALSHADQKPAVRFWVDPKHGVAMAETWYDDEGFPIFASYYAEIDFPKTLPKYAFQLPAGIAVRDFPSPKELEGTAARKALDFVPMKPAFIPAGFKPIGMELTQWPTHRKLHYRYSDGLRDLSVYENLRHGIYHRLNGAQIIHSNNDALELLEEPNGTVVRFPEGKLTIAVEGNLSAKTLAQVALSIATPVHLDSIASSQNQSFLTRLAHYFKRGLVAIKHTFSKIN